MAVNNHHEDDQVGVGSGQSLTPVLEKKRKEMRGQDEGSKRREEVRNSGKEPNILNKNRNEWMGIKRGLAKEPLDNRSLDNPHPHESSKAEVVVMMPPDDEKRSETMFEKKKFCNNNSNHREPNEQEIPKNDDHPKHERRNQNDNNRRMIKKNPKRPYTHQKNRRSRHEVSSVGPVVNRNPSLFEKVS